MRRIFKLKNVIKISFCRKGEWICVLIGKTQLKNSSRNKNGNEIKEQLAEANCSALESGKNMLLVERS